MLFLHLLLYLHRSDGMKEGITLVQLKEGGPGAFSRLFTLYYRDLVLYAGRYLSDQTECEDIVQDTFLKIWNRRYQLEITVSLRLYLIGAVRNRCLNELKHRRLTFNTTIETLTWMPARIEEEATLYSELHERFEQALQTLPPLCREAFEMNRFQHMKYQDIADRLGVSKRTIEVRIGKALALLRENLRDFLPLILFFNVW